MVDLSEERFEELVADALDAIPEALGRLMDNVAIVVQDGRSGSGILGWYEGVPLTERDGGYDGMVLPDRITIYRLPILAICADATEVVEQVRITVVHEVAHHFGIDDERLDELGWA